MAVSLNFLRRVGARPGSPFSQYVAVSGKAGAVSVSGLPESLQYDEEARLISGTTPARGSYVLRIRASDEKAEAEATMEIVSGEQIALTPPLGWSSWNCYGKFIDDKKIRAIADAIVSTGLINYGWNYVNIDDGWQGERCRKAKALQPNEKFPDMKGLCDYVHSLGLKIGTYSTPWKISYAGFTGGAADTADCEIFKTGEKAKEKHGEFKFHDEDAKQFAEWGFDYLKYDWNPIDIHHTRIMSEALRNCGRDIVFSLSNSAPFEHACEWARYAQVWRTTGDIIDSFKPRPDAKIWEHSVCECGFMTQDKWGPFAGPGHWNDPDMLVVGRLGWGKELRDSGLSQVEQKTHITLWSLLASPLLLGCDLTQLDDKLLELLTNEEVLAVNQDVLGVQARKVRKDGGSIIHQRADSVKTFGEMGESEVWCKRLTDGSCAVGLFNLNLEKPREVAFCFADIAMDRSHVVRDLWSRKELGRYEAGFAAEIEPHGCMMLRVM